jgi:beta-lactamase regulating signal transducer with metallopeptidase domain
VIEALLDHVWQSTLFAAAAALSTLLFRTNAASIRFKILLAASLKFLLPFSLLVLLGQHMHRDATPTASAPPQWSLVVRQIMQPASSVKLDFEPPAGADGAEISAEPAPPTLDHLRLSIGHWRTGTWMFLGWCVGCAVLLGRWLLRWIKLRALVAVAVPLDIEAPIPVRETATTLEPGVCGILAPVLLLPRGITTRLTSEELDAVLEHELCHWWRRDNLTAALHMFVEALFWFHPLVWWLGSRLVAERERACDEDVIRSGTDRQTYAEGILKACRLYVEPPLLCVTGVSGGTLRQRIEDIMTSQTSKELPSVKKCLLSFACLAAVAGPLAIGLALGPQGLAQAQEQPTGGSNGLASKHYQNRDWNFALDVPGGWSRFPPNVLQSPSEITHFVAAGETGRNALYIFRSFFDTQKSVGAYLTAHEEYLQKNNPGNANFRTGESTLGTRQVPTLEYSRPTADGRNTLSFRQYFFIERSVLYILSFSTTSATPDTSIPLQDRIAQSFTFDAST